MGLGDSDTELIKRLSRLTGQRILLIVAWQDVAESSPTLPSHLPIPLSPWPTPQAVANRPRNSGEARGEGEPEGVPTGLHPHLHRAERLETGLSYRKGAIVTLIDVLFITSLDLFQVRVASKDDETATLSTSGCLKTPSAHLPPP